MILIGFRGWPIHKFHRVYCRFSPTQPNSIQLRLTISKRLLIGSWRLAGNLPELFVEAGEVLKAAGVADLLDIHVIINQHFAGVSDSDFDNELGKLLACAGFEVPAKGVWGQARNRSYFFEGDFFAEMGQCIFVDRIEPLIFLLGPRVAESQRGKYIVFRHLVCDNQAFHQQHYPIGPLSGMQLFHESRDRFAQLTLDGQAAFGLIQHVSQHCIFREHQKTFSPEVFGEMHDRRKWLLIVGLVRLVLMIVVPVMRQVGAHQHDIAGGEMPDIVTDELGAAPLVETNKLHFRMAMPPAIDVGNQFFSD